MLTSTIDIIRSGLKADPTFTPAERKRVLTFVQNFRSEDKTNTAAEVRLIRRAEAARRLSCSLRTVDNLARAGILQKRNLPGRVRASGFLEADLINLITSESNELINSITKPVP